MKLTLGKLAVTATATSAALLIPVGLAQAKVHPPQHPVPVHRLSCANVPGSAQCAGFIRVTSPKPVLVDVSASGAFDSVAVFWTETCNGVQVKQGQVGGFTPYLGIIPVVTKPGKVCVLDVNADAIGGIGAVSASLKQG